MQKCKIWIIEDEVDIIETYADFFSDMFELQIFTNSAQLREAIASHSRPDLILADLKLPCISTRDLLALVKDFAHDIPVIYASGLMPHKGGPATHRDTSFAFLEKPFNFDQLEREVKRAIAMKRILELSLIIRESSNRLVESFEETVQIYSEELQASSRIAASASNDLQSKIRLLLNQAQHQENNLGSINIATDEIIELVKDVFKNHLFSLELSPEEQRTI